MSKFVNESNKKVVGLVLADEFANMREVFSREGHVVGTETALRFMQENGTADRILHAIEHGKIPERWNAAKKVETQTIQQSVSGVKFRELPVADAQHLESLADRQDVLTSTPASPEEVPSQPPFYEQLGFDRRGVQFDDGYELSGLTLDGLQEQVRRWAEYNFPDENFLTVLFGMGEEMGELFHAELKGSLGIRYSDVEVMDKIQDAVGDLIIFTAAYCYRRNLNLQNVVEQVWGSVRLRDWRTYPKNGRTE